MLHNANKRCRAHLVHDLSPYICTYEDCKNPEQMYDDRHDWIHHENSCHRKVWRCPEHTGHVFTHLGEYRDHLCEEHNGGVDDELANRIIRASESVSTVTDRPCPICSVVLNTARALQSHIALHLERFALFSLPRSVASGGDRNDDDDDEDADSAKAIGTLEDSRDEDFEEGMEINGEGADDETGKAVEETEGTKVESHRQGKAFDVDNKASLIESNLKVADGKTPNSNDSRDEAESEEGAQPRANPVVKGTTVKHFEDHNTPVYMVAFSPDDKLLASVSDDRVVRIWDLEKGISRKSLEGHKKGFRSLAWSHDGRTIASGSYDKTIKLWNAGTGTCLHTLPGHEGAISGLSFSSDDKYVASASHDKTCKLWEVDTGTLRFELVGHTVGVWSIGISPDDRYIVSGSNDRTVKIWDFASGSLLRTLRGHGRVIYTIAFTPENRLLATSGNDMNVKLWELDSGNLLRSFKAHEKGVTALAFSPDGSLMASASYDRSVKIWETTTWTNIGVLEGHSADVYGVSFSYDGRRVASGSRDRTVRLWEIAFKSTTLLEGL